MALNGQAQSTFFKLPAELRNTIYGLCLVPAPENTLTKPPRSPPPQSLTSGPNAFPLLQATRLSPKVRKHLLYTCKKIAQEAHGIYIDAYRSYWRNSVFTLTATSTLAYRRHDAPSAKKLRKQLATVKPGDYANITHLVIIVETPDRSFAINIRLNWAGPQPRTSTVAFGGNGESRGLDLFLLMVVRSMFKGAETKRAGMFDAKEELIGYTDRLTQRLGPLQ